MGSFLKSRGFRIARLIFRWTRIVLWFCIFLVVVSVAYLHLIGLPEFLKARLLGRLEEAGFEARFSNARIGWGPDVEIENAFFRSDHPLAPRLSAGRTRVNFDLQALRHRRLEVRSFLVEDGRLEFPLSETNNQALSVNDVVLGIELSNTNILQITEAAGSFHGIQIVLNGTATNYTAMLAWKPFHVRPRANETFQEQLQRFARTLDQIHFQAAPQFHVHATADGNDPDTLRADLHLSTGRLETPWGKAETLSVSAAASHLATPTGAPIIRAQVSCSRFSSDQGRASKLDLTTVLSRDAASNFEAAIHLRGSQLHSDHCEILLGPTNNWFEAARVQADGAVGFAATNFAPFGGAGTVEASQAAARVGSVQKLHVDLKVSTVARSPGARPDWGPFSPLDGIEADWQTRASGVTSPKLDVERFSCSGQWRAPVVTLDNIVARAYRGDVNASGTFDAGSRELRIKGRSDLDPHRVTQLLSAPVQRFLTQYDWEKPPHVEARTRLVLPPWTNRPPDWRTTLLGSVQFGGHFTVGHASFRNLAADSAESDFIYSNRVWHVPRLHALAGGGEVYLAYTDSEISHDFHFDVDSRMDPASVAPLIPTNARVWLDDFRFTTAPAVHGQVWGRWRAHERIGFNAAVTVSNFWFRNEKIDGLAAGVEYTNHIIQLSNVSISAGTGILSASHADGDLSTKECSVTNVLSTLDLDTYRRLLGSRTPEFLNRIHFGVRPSINLSGSFVTTNPLATDVHFTVSGDRFRWTNLDIDNISTLGSWLGREVALTNIHAKLYDTGTLTGWGVFDYLPRESTSFRGSFSARSINLRNLVRSWSMGPKRLEGILDADIVITGGNTKSLGSWSAFGSLHAHDALLWDIPMFGVLSPVLNAISPGMGESHARDASATFQITNGVATTEDLMIHATGISLSYRGSINTNKQLNARVEARNVLGPVVGLFLSPLSKLFEYKITGPASHPTMEPLYIPNFLMKIVRPFHTLKQLLPSSPVPSQPPSSANPAETPKH